MNVKRVQFLDVLLDLENNCYQPYHKNNNKLSYVHSGSNHPRMVLNNIPAAINRRLSFISSNETCFNQEKSEYQKALHESGHEYILDYQKGLGNEGVKVIHGSQRYRSNNLNKGNKTLNNNSRRDIIWFTPPFNIFCSTNVGEIFRNLIKKTFCKK